MYAMISPGMNGLLKMNFASSEFAGVGGDVFSMSGAQNIASAFGHTGSSAASASGRNGSGVHQLGKSDYPVGPGLL